MAAFLPIVNIMKRSLFLTSQLLCFPYEHYANHNWSIPKNVLWQLVWTLKTIDSVVIELKLLKRYEHKDSRPYWLLSELQNQLSADSKNPETIIWLVQYASLKLSFILWTRTIQNKINKMYNSFTFLSLFYLKIASNSSATVDIVIHTRWSQKSPWKIINSAQTGTEILAKSLSTWNNK